MFKQSNRYESSDFELTFADSELELSHLCKREHALRYRVEVLLRFSLFHTSISESRLFSSVLQTALTISPNARSAIEFEFSDFQIGDGPQEAAGRREYEEYKKMRAALSEFEEGDTMPGGARARAFFRTLRSTLHKIVNEGDEDKKIDRIAATYRWFEKSFPRQGVEPRIRLVNHPKGPGLKACRRARGSRKSTCGY